MPVEVFSCKTLQDLPRQMWRDTRSLCIIRSEDTRRTITGSVSVELVCDYGDLGSGEVLLQLDSCGQAHSTSAKNCEAGSQD